MWVLLQWRTTLVSLGLFLLLLLVYRCFMLDVSSKTTCTFQSKIRCSFIEIVHIDSGTDSLFLCFLLVKWEKLGSINFFLALLIDSTIDCSISFKSNMDSQYFFEYLFKYLYIARNGQITKLGVSRFHFAMMIIFAMLLLLL